MANEWSEPYATLPLAVARMAGLDTRFTPAATAFFTAVADAAIVFLAAIATDEIVTD